MMTSIGDEDMHALMEVSAGLHGLDLDLILHSPGGAPVAAEAIVSYLRSRFSHIRVIVPQLAMSAATMIACAADKIMMGKHSFLGPTDLSLSVFHSTIHTFSSTPATKIVENHTGRAFLRHFINQTVRLPIEPSPRPPA